MVVAVAVVASLGPHRPCAVESSRPFYEALWRQHNNPTQKGRVRLGFWYRPVTRPCPVFGVAVLRKGIVIDPEI